MMHQKVSQHVIKVKMSLFSIYLDLLYVFLCVLEPLIKLGKSIQQS